MRPAKPDLMGALTEAALAFGLSQGVKHDGVGFALLYGGAWRDVWPHIATCHALTGNLSLPLRARLEYISSRSSWKG